MKSYFLNLFRYDRFASLLILDVIKKTENPDASVKLMAHMLAAQQTWLSRCKDQPVSGHILWPDWQADTFEQTINSNHQEWINFLEYLSPGDFENSVGYKNTKGHAFESKLSDILTQVINHGTHHRAQIGMHLKLAGADLPLTDYIFYLRTQGL